MLKQCVCACVFYLSQSTITDICGANLLEGKERQSALRGTLASARMSGALTDCHVSKAAFFANSFAKHLLSQKKKKLACQRASLRVMLIGVTGNSGVVLVTGGQMMMIRRDN